MAKTLQLWPAVFIYSPGALQPSFLSLNKTAEGKAAEKREERERKKRARKNDREKEQKKQVNLVKWLSVGALSVIVC